MDSETICTTIKHERISFKKFKKAAKIYFRIGNTATSGKKEVAIRLDTKPLDMMKSED